MHVSLFSALGGSLDEIGRFPLEPDWKLSKDRKLVVAPEFP
jgi:hypothetical protein